MLVLTDLCDRKCSYIAGNDFMRVWANLCYMECFSVTNCWLELQFEFSRQNSNRNVQTAEPFYVVMTHHTAKANLENGSSWPPEVIPYGVPHTRGLVLTQAISPTPWTRPQIPLGLVPPYNPIVN